MATKQFYLLGDSPSTARNVAVNPSGDLKALRTALVDTFSIAGPQGVYQLILHQ
jgi:hypothetical protein